jgi:TPR repeat protein
MAMEDETTDRKKNRTSYRTEVLMALAAIVTVLAMWLWPVDEEQAPPPLPQPLSAPQGAAEHPPSPVAAESAAAAAGGEQARAFIARLRADSEPPDADVVFTEAERLQGNGNLDDAYLLYRFAARHGNAQAALVLGTQADPAYYTDATGYLPGPEPEQAYKWYRVAIAAGNQEAVTRLQDLRKRLEQAAAGGDEQAQRLMLLWR